MTYCSLEKADSPKARKYRCQLLKRRQEEMGEKFLGETPDSLTDGTFLGFPRGIKEFYLREIFSEMEQVRQKNIARLLIVNSSYINIKDIVKQKNFNHVNQILTIKS